MPSRPGAGVEALPAQHSDRHLRSSIGSPPEAGRRRVMPSPYRWGRSLRRWRYARDSRSRTATRMDCRAHRRRKPARSPGRSAADGRLNLRRAAKPHPAIFLGREAMTDVGPERRLRPLRKSRRGPISKERSVLAVELGLASQRTLHGADRRIAQAVAISPRCMRIHHGRLYHEQARKARGI